MQIRASWLALLGGLVAGCGGPGGSSPPPAPQPPGVTVIPHSNPAVDTQFLVDVSVTGCDSVASVSLADGQTVLATATNPPARTTFTIASNQVNYKTDGIAATLDLLATATCANGAKNTGPGVGQIFMPAAEVFSGVFPFTSLSLEPDGSGLITCQDGSVVRLGTDGVATASTGPELGFSCSLNGYTVRNGPNEIYWVELGAYVARLDANLNVLGTFAFAANSVYAIADANCPAVVFDNTGGNMFWINRTTGAGEGAVALSATISGAPGFGTEGLIVPEQTLDPDGTSIDLQVERFNVSTGVPYAAPTIVASLSGDSIYGSVLNLSANGEVAYFVAGSNSDQLWACTADTVSPCYDRSTAGGGLLFQVTIPGGPFSVAQPIGNYLVVAGPHAVQFTNTSGTPVGDAVMPSPGLQVQNIYSGSGDEFYILDGDGAGDVLEVILLTTPGIEAARFHVDTGGFGMDIDENGVPYLLIESELAKLLTPDQYLDAQQ